MTKCIQVRAKQFVTVIRVNYSLVKIYFHRNNCVITFNIREVVVAMVMSVKLCGIQVTTMLQYAPMSAKAVVCQKPPTLDQAGGGLSRII